MKKLSKIFLLFVFTLSAGLIQAQNQIDMRLNEVLVLNTDDYMDDFGHKGEWLELFNSSYGIVNIGGCYLTNDPSNLKKYVIPKGDVNTIIQPRQYVLFWADGKPTRGTFHINFKLDDSKELLFVGSDGKTIIDRITIPHNLLDTNKSYGRLEDGIGSTDGSGNGWGVLERTTPRSSNIGIEKEPAHVVIKRVDPFGAIMAMTAMSVVFTALILLYLSFKYLGKNAIKKAKQKLDIENKTFAVNEGTEEDAEQLAAISLAIDLYLRELEIHDYEYTVLTRNEGPKVYSPWSSKIHTLRETPVRKF